MKNLAIAVLAVALGLGLGLGATSGTRMWAGIGLVAWQVLASFVVQWIGYLHSWTAGTERYFDLIGSCTYVFVTLLGLASGSYRSAASWLLALLVVIWAVRLGTFLFLRIRRAGHDDRFDEILRHPSRLFLTWTLQGLWVSMTALAAWVGIQSAGGRIHPTSWIGVAIWAVGFAIEVVADQQKYAFRARRATNDEFIRTGLWAWSRHPNYFGEIVLWVGVLITACPYLHGWQWLALVSPLFVTLLLTRVSGIPLLERKADARWGQRRDYQDYKAATPLLVPRPPRARSEHS